MDGLGKHAEKDFLACYRLFNADLSNLNEICAAKEDFSNPVLQKATHAVFNGLLPYLFHLRPGLNQ